MGIFKRLFGKKKEPSVESKTESKELLRLRDLDAFMRSLLKADHYVARSEYLQRMGQEKDLADWFNVLKTSGTLGDSAKRTGSSVNEMTQTIRRYENLKDLVDAQNEQYVQMQMVKEKD